MSKKEITFQEIVQMIADKTVPAGAVFYTPSDIYAYELIQAKMEGNKLCWVDGVEDNRVQLESNVINDPWYIEVPEVELTLSEALAVLADGHDVKAVSKKNGTTFVIDYVWDLSDIYDDTDIEFLEDLLEYTFYKVGQ